MKQVFQKLTGRKGYNNQHKMCPHCGKFVEESDVTCPYCQGSVGHIRVFKERATVKSDGQVETTWLLMGICMFFYLLQAIKTSDFMSLGIPFIPDKGVLSAYTNPNFAVGMAMGSNYPFLIQAWNEYWRLIQYMFLHGGIIHLGFNLYAVAMLGPMVNQAFGIRRFWVLVFVTGLTGGIWSASKIFFYSNFGPSVGVSGAIFGLVGAMYAFFKCRGNFMEAERFKKFMIYFNVICIILSVFDIFSVDNLAHLGGMFSGIGLGFLFYKLASSQWLKWIEIAVLIAVVGLWFSGLIDIYHYLNNFESFLEVLIPVLNSIR